MWAGNKANRRYRRRCQLANRGQVLGIAEGRLAALQVLLMRLRCGDDFGLPFLLRVHRSLLLPTLEMSVDWVRPGYQL